MKGLRKPWYTIAVVERELLKNCTYVISIAKADWKTHKSNKTLKTTHKQRNNKNMKTLVCSVDRSWP